MVDTCINYLETEENMEGFMANATEINDTILGQDHRVPLFCDLSLFGEVTIDGGKGIVLGPRPSSHRYDNHEKNRISPGLKFTTLLKFKHWIKDYLVKKHRTYKVVHSDVKKPYGVK
jgi:hypothetical protein